jgi:two-component system, NarL family, sensor kinase
VDRPRRIRDIALVVLAACAPFVLLFAGRLTAPADGTATFPSAPAWGDGVVVASVTGPTALRAGDRVLAVDGVPIETWVARPGHFSRWQTLVYAISRNGSSEVTTVPVGVRRYPLARLVRENIALHPLLISMLAVASFVLLRRPRDRAARALFRLAALLPMGLTAFPYSTQVIDVVSGRLWPLVVADTCTLGLWGAVLHFAFVFPRPRGAVARHPRLAAAVAYLLPVLLYIGHLLLTVPTATSELARIGDLVTISVPAANTVPLVAGAVMVVSYWRARDAVVRHQLLWVFLAFGFGFAAYILLGRLPEWLSGAPLLPWTWLTVFFLPVPAALGAAVLRYRVFDVDLFLRRSLIYGSLTAALGLIYLGTAALFAWIFGTPLEAAPLAAGAAVIVLVLSLRERLRRMVIRLVFGERDDPYEVVRRLGQRLDATAPADTVLQSIAETLAQTLRLPYVRVELSGLAPHTASHGSPSGEAVTAIPLIHRGEEVGRLVLDTGAVREPFGPGDRRLLDGLARQVGMTAYNLVLTVRLQRSLERVVAAREEERRRLRRDIHDGLGPVLASGGMRLELAQALVRTDPVAAQALLADLAGTQQQALVDLRRLVEGLRPPVLDHLGLAGALRQRADRFAGLCVTVDAAQDVEPLPAAVEVAAYHIVSEAVTNAARHAGAQTCAVRIWREDGLRVEVRDDGVGLPDDYRAGTGLQSIRERATELGGDAAATREDTGGTTVRARLPLSAPPTLDEGHVDG